MRHTRKFVYVVLIMIIISIVFNTMFEGKYFKYYFFILDNKILLFTCLLQSRNGIINNYCKLYLNYFYFCIYLIVNSDLNRYFKSILANCERKIYIHVIKYNLYYQLFDITTK